MTLSTLNGIPLSIRTYLLLTVPVAVLMERWREAGQLKERAEAWRASR